MLARTNTEVWKIIVGEHRDGMLRKRKSVLPKKKIKIRNRTVREENARNETAATLYLEALLVS